MIHLAKGVSLICPVECEKYGVPGYAIDDMNQYGGFEDVDYIQAAAAYDEEKQELNVFVINADLEEAQELTLDLRAFRGYEQKEQIEMHADNPQAVNTFEHPDVLLPRSVKENLLDGGMLTAKLEKASWNVFRFGAKRG